MRQMADRRTSISSLDNKRRVRAAGTLALALTLAGTVSTEACAGGMGTVIGAPVVAVPSSFTSVIMQPRITSPPVPIPQSAPGSCSSVQPSVQQSPGLVNLPSTPSRSLGVGQSLGPAIAAPSYGGQQGYVRRAELPAPQPPSSAQSPVDRGVAGAAAAGAVVLIAGAALPIPRYRG